MYAIITLKGAGFMNSKNVISKNLKTKLIIVFIVASVLLVASSLSIGYMLGTKQNSPQNDELMGYAANPDYEYMVGSTAWQMSAEAHALMMQGFHIAEKNID